MSLAERYMGVAIFAMLALLLPTVTFFMTRLFRPKKSAFGTSSFMLGLHWRERTRGEYRNETYECGNDPVGHAHIDFHFQYYMYAIIFIVTDVVVMFLFLWGIAFDQLTVWGRYAILGFLALLMTGVMYALHRESKVWI